jgi:glycerol kinase
MGLTRGVTAGHLARAALEGVALQSMDVICAMEADTGMKLSELRVDGGATANNLLMQIQADLLRTRVVRPRVKETTALGTAYLAGLAVDYWEGLETLSSQWSADRIFEPEIPEAQVAELRGRWLEAVGRSKSWVSH